MVVYYKLLSGGSYVVLFDDAAGATLTDHKGQFIPVIQESQIYGSATQARFGRGNVKCNRTFNVLQTYSGADTALVGIVTNEALLDQKMHLKIVQGTTAVYFPNALITGLSYDQIGAAIRYAMSFSSDPITSNAI